MGRGRPPRPSRSCDCTTLAVRCCCWQPRVRSSSTARPTWGQRGSRRRHALARGALLVRHRPHGRRADPGRAAGGSSRASSSTRAEGNPFFVEELVRTLIDQGVLERLNGGWTVRDLPDDFVVPDTVQAVLAARIDLLEPAEKAALQAAAVIGRTFWAGPVDELLEGVEADLARARGARLHPPSVELVDRRGAQSSRSSTRSLARSPTAAC